MLSHFQIRPPRFWEVLLRGLLLALGVTFAVRLSLAEIEYVRGWQPGKPLKPQFEALARAEQDYPFNHRFREGATVRVKLLAERGK